MGTTYHYENNESVSVGIFRQRDGSFLALTRSASKEFKTEAGARKWLAKRGVSA